MSHRTILFRVLFFSSAALAVACGLMDPGTESAEATRSAAVLPGDSLTPNSTFDSNLAGWSTLDGATAKIIWNGSDRKALVDNVSGQTSGLGRVIPVSQISRGGKLHASARFKLVLGSAVGTVYIRVKRVDGAGTRYETIAQGSANGWGWDQPAVTGSWTVNWTGTLSSLTVFATSTNDGGEGFVVDDFALNKEAASTTGGGGETTGGGETGGGGGQTETEELITNGEFNGDLASWSVLNGATAKIVWNGSDRNAKVENLGGQTSGLGQTIAVSRVSKGDELHATAKFKLALGSATGTAYVRAKLVDDAGTSYITLAQAGVNGWTSDKVVTGSAAVTWTGTLRSLTLFATATGDFFVDSVSVVRQGTTSGVQPQGGNLPLAGFLFQATTEYGQPHESDWTVLMPWAESSFDIPARVGNRWMGNGSWDAILAVDRSPTWMLLGPFRDWLQADTQNRVLLFAVPPFPNFGRGHDTEREQWKAAARGDFNAYYTELAKRVTAIYPNDGNTIVTRFAWEFDGDWYHFGTAMNKGNTEWGPYVRAAFRHFIDCFEAVRPATKHSWNLANIPNQGQVPLPNWRAVMDAYYPGNDYIDFIDLDLYDYFQWSCGNDPNNQDHHVCRAARAQSWIDVLRQYAQEKGKLIAHSEWGLWSTTGPEFDNSKFIETMWNHLLSGGVAYHSYFNSVSDGAERRLNHPDLANSLSKYRQMGEASTTNWLR